MAEPLYGNCLLCLAKTNANTVGPFDATLIVLVMLEQGHAFESIRRDLCSAHFRQLVEVARG